MRVDHITLGPYRLGDPIGGGGMGQVWSGNHLDSGIPVAIKVLTERRVTDARFRKAFRNEARAVAALDHPNVVEIYDLGEIPSAVSEACGGRLVARAPYLVMEFVGGGTLAQRRGRMDWADLKLVLVSLLDGLAHAHARGVIHRDLKPGNVLFGEGGRGVKLGDFGLAKAMHREGVTVDTTGSVLGGTPAYMAPEQFHGSSRDVGPWTDLYALGCLVWSMVRGEPPFGRKPWIEVANGHLFGEVPALNAPFPVPVGFERWCRGLLAKEVRARYRRAADAAWDLASLPDPEPGRRVGPARTPTDDPEATLLRIAHSVPTAPLGREGATTLVWNSAALPTRGSTPEPQAPDTTSHRAPPIPFSWRGFERRQPGRHPIGAALYAHRFLPLVDRVAERETLWRALRRCQRRGRPQVVALHGAAGFGKTRLAEWLSQRAHELGAAEVLTAVHSPITTRADGLGAMCVRHLRARGLAREAQVERIEGQLALLGVDDLDLRRALIEILAPSTLPARPRIPRVQQGADRHGPLRSLLERLVDERPVVLWLDDVQWGLDALEFASYLLDAPSERPLPILMLLTVRDEALPVGSVESSVLDAILARTCAERLHVGPLPDEDRETLVRDLLGLEPELAARVEVRTGGNPQFAVRLVGDWMERGLLEPSEAGHRLRAGAEIYLPDDLHQVWNQTVSQVLERLPATDAIALEIAAVLGQDVAMDEWSEACRRSGASPSSRLLERLLAQRLASAVDPEREWWFAQAMLRESLLRRAREGGRSAAHHRACASALRGGHVSGDAAARIAPRELERIARHLVEAGDEGDALQPLLSAAVARLDHGEVRAAGTLLAERERILAGLPADGAWHDRAARGWVVASRLARLTHRPEEAVDWAQRAVSAARTAGRASLTLDALRERIANLMVLGRVDDARETVSLAITLARSSPHTGRLADLTADLGFLDLQRQDLDGARAAFHDAIAQYRAAGDDAGAAPVWLGLADLARRTGAYDLGIDCAEEARGAYARQQNRHGVATATCHGADLRRLRGDLDAAEQGLREARRQFAEIGLPGHLVTHVNLALVELDRGRYAAARDALEACLESGDQTWYSWDVVEQGPPSRARTGASGSAVGADPDARVGSARAVHDDVVRRPGLLATIQAALAVCAAGGGRWDAYDAWLSAALDRIAREGVVDPDLAMLLERSGTLAERELDPARATRACSAALAQWRALGRTDTATLERRIADLRQA